MRKLYKAIILCSLSVLVQWPQSSWGHAFPVHAEPRVGITVNVPPTHVRIWFNTSIEPTLSTLHVQNEKGEQVDNRDGQVTSSDTKLLEVSLPILPPGTYYIIWSVVDSGHGHRTTGDYIFIVK